MTDTTFHIPVLEKITSRNHIMMTLRQNQCVVPFVDPAVIVILRGGEAAGKREETN
jgi:hypothetical protein